MRTQDLQPHIQLFRVAVALVCALLVVATGVRPVAAADRPTPPDPTVVTNGPVQAIVRAGDTVYIGGRFDRIGPRTGPGVEVDLDGTQRTEVAEVSGAGPTAVFGAGGAIEAAVADGAGGWFIGGLFSHVGGIPRTNLAHILADGSVDPGFAPVLDDAVRSLVVAGSSLYAAGSFTTVDGQPRNRVAALRTADGGLTAFDPAADAPVEALAVSEDGRIVYAGGRFTRIGGLPRLSLAALDAATGAATPTFAPAVVGSVGPGVVDALAISGSTLYVGGSFRAIGGLPRDNLAALGLGLPLDGVALPAFDAAPSRVGCAACGSVATLAVSGGTVYAGGSFDRIGGQPRTFLAGLDARTGAATPFNPAPNGNVSAIAVSGSTVYAAGGFRSIDGAPSIGGAARNHVAALDARDGTATAFDPDPNGGIRALAVSADGVYMGGSMSSLGGVVRNGIAAIDARDGTVTDFDPDARGHNGGSAIVYELAVSGGTVYVGGFFSAVGGQPREGIAAVDAASGLATGWDPGARRGAGPASVNALAVHGSVVYAGGNFGTIGGESRSNVAAIDVATGAATSWDPDANSIVEALVVAGDVVYAGGFFTSIGGAVRNKIAALSAADGTATGWAPDPTSMANVLALAVSGSTVYAGGNFTQFDGVPRRNLAGIDARTAALTAFDPQASDPTSGGGVHALAVDERGDDPTVYAAGFFSEAGGRTRHLLAGLDAADGRATDFDPQGSPGFGAFALDIGSDGALYVGGSFDTFALGRQQGIARFTP